MDYVLGLISLLIGYLAGSINFARIITRLKSPKRDLDALATELVEGGEHEFLGGFGAATTGMVFGTKLGIATAFLDMLKVIIPMLLMKQFFPGDPYYLIIGFGGLLGHNWPIYYGFKGGRGMAVVLGSFLVLDWIGTPITILVGFILAFVFFGVPMLAYILWMWLMIPWALWRLDSPEVIFLVLMNISFLIGAVPDIKTMLRMKRTGEYDAYSEKLYKTSMRLRWMKDMTDRLWILGPILNKNKGKGLDQSS